MRAMSYSERIVRLVRASYAHGVTEEHVLVAMRRFVDVGVLRPAPLVFAQVLAATRAEPEVRDEAWTLGPPEGAR